MNKPQRLTLIQQNDTHGYLAPHWELGWHAGRPQVWRAGGYAHIRALADRIREQTAGACIHIDSGDAIHGTGPAQWTEGAAIVPALNAVGVELMTPGNWEFGFGPGVLRERVAEMDFPVIACNVERADTSEPEFAATQMREIAGVDIAFIGITSPIVSRTMPPAYGAGLRFLDAIAVLPDLVARVRERERPDVVVLVSHYGLAQEVVIARQVEGIDVILGGHTHDVLAEPVIVGRTIITQSGAHGSYLTRLDLELKNGRVCGYQHELLAVEEEAVADPKVAGVVEQVLAPQRAALAEVVGETERLLHRGTVLESPMDNLITEAYRHSTGADIALSHGWRYGAPIVPGPITLGDLWQMIPTNPELFTVELTGAELRRIIEKSIEQTFAGDALRQQGGYVIRIAGMHVVARLNNPAGARIQQLEIGGVAASPARKYRVAAAGEQSATAAGERAMTGVRAIDSLRSYLRMHRPAPSPSGAARFVAV